MCCTGCGSVEGVTSIVLAISAKPRICRSGKSLYCSILECYYDVNRATKFESLFTCLNIGVAPTTERNSCMVFRLNFSKIDVKASHEAIEKSFNGVRASAFMGFVKEYRQQFGIAEASVMDGSASGFLDAVIRSCPEDVAQAERYIAELLPDHPGPVPSRHVVYTSGNAEYRFF